MSKNLLSAFNIEVNKEKYYNKKDYDVFKNKDLLDSFRIKILEKLSDRSLYNKLDRDDIIEEIKATLAGYEISNEERIYLYNLIDNEVNGYGPLTELLAAKDINEIMVNGYNEVYVESNGKIIKDDSVSFIDDKHIIRVVQSLISETGKVIDVNNPIVDAILPDGSRVNAIVPPISLHPTITIRKFKQNLVEMNTLVGNGTLTPYMAEFLSAAMEAKFNIIISGGTSCGKTSILNTLSNYIKEDDRTITIEDSRELNLKSKMLIQVHDELVFNVLNSEKDKVLEIVKDIMENTYKLNVPLVVDINIGNNWYEAK